MDFRPEIRQRLLRTADWHAIIDELERDAEAAPTDAQKSEQLYELGLLAEEIIPVAVPTRQGVEV